eukprot:CAMPEP_0180643296 /NCGR_PEP_ID=MMETSP1037_2-20121125/47725_1 /TAXON_ID=632150 /ORGANISM="Azadinium spinosum, Strain 3D9" /LENGTH=44 /DNA_ID= /DNA_START= /DNA_END= /DNA_ORIENTATION=
MIASTAVSLMSSSMFVAGNSGAEAISVDVAGSGVSTYNHWLRHS